MVVSTSTLLYLFVSIILGVFAFMISSATQMWWKRNKQEVKQRGPLPLLWVISRFILLLAAMITVILSIRELLPYEIYSTQGVLKGEGLFPVRAIEGYEGRIEGTNGVFKSSEPLVSYTRRLGPAEEAEARLQRALLEENIAELRASLDAPNPIRELQKLSEAERLRAAEEIKEENRNRALLEMESLKFRINEQESNVTLAQKEMEFARDAITTGLISKIEYDRRQQKLRQAELRLKELKTRLDFEMRKAMDISTETGENNDAQLKAVLRSAVTDLSMQPSNAMLTDLERKLRELDRLLSLENMEPIIINAPWDGIIGYQNPTSVLAPQDLIAVLAQPTSLFVEVLVPIEVFKAVESDSIINLTNPYLSELGVTLTGEFRHSKITNPNQRMILVGLEPRSDLVNDIAMNKEVMLQVSFINQPPNIFKELKMFFSQMSSVNIVLIIAVLLLAIMLLLRPRNNLVKSNTSDGVV